MKILIVDDNPDILEGLSGGIAWEENGFEPPFLAEHAMAAKQILTKEGIDILMTDIEMPGESGLALFDWLKEYDPGIPCIFLTSHASFSYCQQAMRNGGYDYILQPARLSEIESVIRRCREELIGRRRNRALLEKGLEYDRVFLVALKQLCYSLFTKGDAFGSQMEEWTAQTDPDGELSGYLPAVFALMDKGDRAKAEAFQEMLSGLLAGAVGAKRYILTELTSGVFGVVLFSAPDREEAAELRILAEAQAGCRDALAAESALYTGMRAKRDLPHMAGRLMALRRDNVYERSGIFSLTDETALVQIRDPDRKKWENQIVSGDGVLVQNQIRNLIRHADAEGTLSLEYMKLLAGSYREALTGACHQAGFHFHELFEGNRGLRQFEEAYQHVTTFIDAVERTRKEFDRRRRENDQVQAMSMEERMQAVCEYIEMHLAEPLSRADLAGMVFLSEDYFARMFKSVCGRGVKEYVMQCRMEYAMTLLRETSFPVSVVASRVGYDNFSNFAQAFKKYTGVPPKEYRRNAAEDGS